MTTPVRIVFVHGIGTPTADGAWADALAQRVWQDAQRRGMVTNLRTVTWGTDIEDALAPVRTDLKARGVKFSPFRKALWAHGADALVYGGQRSVRNAVLARVERELVSPIPVVLVAHSWGSVVACDALARLYASDAGAPPIGLLTLGAPLAITGTDFTMPSHDFAWVNVYDPLDPIGSPLNGVRQFACEDVALQTTPWYSRLRPVAGPLQAHTAYWSQDRVAGLVVTMAARLAG